MKTIHPARRGALLLTVFVSSFTLLPSAFPQGNLTPPGAPAPTMKTLDQIEPRKEVNATNTPGDSSALFIISSPGSYYLSGNITGVSGKSGIKITADDVTLNLNGFQLKGVSGSGSGIVVVIVSSALRNLAVRNGTVRDWPGGGVSGGILFYAVFEDLRLYRNGAAGLEGGGGSLIRHCIASYNVGAGLTLSGGASDGEFINGGIVEDCVAMGNQLNGINVISGVGTITNCTAYNNAGIGIFTAPVCTLTNCTADFNALGGISAADNCTLTNCTAQFNLNSNGISAGEGSTLTNCTAAGNIGQYGIFADQGSTITNCTARGNQSSATTSSGIHAEPGSTVRGCTSTGNTNSNGSPGPLTGMGIEAFNGSTIKDCTATANKGDGIHVPNDSLVEGNTCDSNGNGTGGDGAGIHATSSDNRIEGNNVTDNDRGIDVDSPGNVIIKNSASGNGPTNNLNYDIVANNVYGAVVDRTAPASAAVTGNSGPASAGTTDPWANISY